MTRKIVIAIDGPSASGKGTLARRLARHFGYAFLDTGGLYRWVGLTVLRAGGDPADPAAATAAASQLCPESLTAADDPALRSDAVAQAASKVAAIPAVRAALLELQRSFAREPPGAAPGAVLDGRDIGTVICPDADAKLFVTASLAARIQRRWAELSERGVAVSRAEVEAEMTERDSRDRNRAVAPLLPAADAHILDTSTMDAGEAFAAALRLLAERRHDASSATVA